MTKAKVAIVGTGHGLRTILPALQCTNEFEVCALSGSSKERAMNFAKDIGGGVHALELAEILEKAEEFDLICLASPNEYHLDHYCAAAKVNTNLYFEKPLGNSHEDANAIRAAFKEFSKDSFLVVGHQLRFNPYIREMKRQWHSGEIGQVYSVSILQRGGAFARDDRAWTWEFERARGGGVRLAMGTHLVDLVRFLSDCKLQNLYVNMDAVHTERRPTGSLKSTPVDVCNSFSASIDGGYFEAQVSTSAASHGPGRFEIEILGSKGALYYNGISCFKAFSEGEVVAQPISDRVESEYLALPGSSIFRKSLCEMAAQMAAAVNGRVNDLSIAANLDDAVEVMESLDHGMHQRNSRIPNRANMF